MLPTHRKGSKYLDRTNVVLAQNIYNPKPETLNPRP